MLDHKAYVVSSSADVIFFFFFISYKACLGSGIPVSF